jgi:hypothetical protein
MSIIYVTLFVLFLQYSEKSICLGFRRIVSVLFVFYCCYIYLYVYLYDLLHILLLLYKIMDPWNVCMCVCMCVCMYVL